MTETPEISVLVPVYKAERYLDACLQSLLAQTFADFEVLLADDESPDASPALCDAWAARDRRVRVLHLKKQSPGPGGARNALLDAARGRFYTFVDSDDTVEPDYLQRLHAAAASAGALWVQCNSRPVAEDGAPLPFDAAETFAADTPLTEQQFWDAFNTPKISLFTGTAHKLYAAALFDGVRYPVGIVHEDYYVLPDVIERAGDKILCLAYFGYNVVQHEGSIMATAHTRVTLYQTMGDIHRAEYFLRRGWFDRAEGALTDAAVFLCENKTAYDLAAPGHRAEYARVKADLTRVYAALAAQKNAAPLKVKALALRMGVPVFCALHRQTARR